MLAVVGPGIIAGLSDDDPAGIATYSILGASFGYALLWTIPAATLLLIIFHLLAVRLGVATGTGFVAGVRQRWGPAAGYVAVSGLVLANWGTICAEFAGIAAACSMAGIPPGVSVPIAAGGIIALLVRGSFHRIERLLIVISASLFAYVFAGIAAKPDWQAVATGLTTPRIPGGAAAMTAVVASIGTTLAPWGLSFIQSYAVDKKLTQRDLRYERVDVIVGSILTGVIGVFVAIACAATLYPAGITITDARDAAIALGPLVGRYATLLFGLGLIGTALLAATVVPLSTAYSIAEADHRPSGLDGRMRDERLFYAALVVLIVTASLVVVTPHMPLITLMYASQVLNCLLLAPQLVVLLVLARTTTTSDGDPIIGRGYLVAASIGVVAVTACVVTYLVMLL